MDLSIVAGSVVRCAMLTSAPSCIVPLTMLIDRIFMHMYLPQSGLIGIISITDCASPLTVLAKMVGKNVTIMTLCS